MQEMMPYLGNCWQAVFRHTCFNKIFRSGSAFGNWEVGMEKIGIMVQNLFFSCWVLNRTEKRQKIPFHMKPKEMWGAVTAEHSQQLPDETDGGSYGNRCGHNLVCWFFLFKPDTELYLYQ